MLIPPPRVRLVALYLTVVGVWGTTWVAMRAAVATVPAITASGLRFAVAFPLLALVLARRPGVSLRYPPGHRRLLALVTLAYFTVPFVLMNLGTAAVPSGLAAVLFATVAVFIVVLSVPALGIRISGRQTAGVTVALGALVAIGVSVLIIALSGGHSTPTPTTSIAPSHTTPGKFVSPAEAAASQSGSRPGSGYFRDPTTHALLRAGTPPLRSAGHRDALWRALADGTIDVV